MSAGEIESRSNSDRRFESPEFGGTVSEADFDEVLQAIIEPLELAGPVGRKVTRSFDAPPRDIKSGLRVNVPPANRAENDQRICLWLCGREPTGDRPGFAGNVGGIDLT